MTRVLVSLALAASFAGAAPAFASDAPKPVVPPLSSTTSAPTLSNPAQPTSPTLAPMEGRAASPHESAAPAHPASGKL